MRSLPRLFVSLVVLVLSLNGAAPKKRPAAGTQARQWLNRMSLREQVAQLVVVPCYGNFPSRRSREYRELQSLVQRTGVGGLIVVNRVAGGLVQNANPFAMAAFLNRMQRLSKVPLIVGADFERGASMRVSDTTKFPHLMAFGAAGDLDSTRYLGLMTARESRALGVHWIYGPDADVNNNPENPIINVRSFSEDPRTVAAHVKAFIEGAHSDPANKVLVTAKHFPGHGDTETDSHMGLGTITASRERLDQVELVPFQAAIEAGVDSIMTAHLAVPSLEPEEIPVTVSKKVMTGLLRDEMGFTGILTTDAMDMAGLAKLYEPGEAAVKALEAGIDVLLMPKKPDATIDAVVRAIQSGRLDRKRVTGSVMKVLNAKVRLGLAKSRFVDIEEIAEVTESAEASERAQLVADRAVTLVRNDRGVLPLSPKAAACLFVLNDSRISRLGRTLIDELRSRAPSIQCEFIDPAIAEAEGDRLQQKAFGCEAVVVATFVTSAAGRGNVALNPAFHALLETWMKGAAPVAFLSFGNPYLIRSYPGVAAYAAMFSTAPTSEIAAAKAIAGEIPFQGKLPVNIPGVAEIGFGLSK